MIFDVNKEWILYNFSGYNADMFEINSTAFFFFLFILLSLLINICK